VNPKPSNASNIKKNAAPALLFIDFSLDGILKVRILNAC